MKRLFLLITLLFIGNFAFAQNNAPKEITPPVLQQLKADVEKQIPAFKQQLLKRKLTAEQIEFSLDTFRIEKLVLKRMDIDYSTVGMNKTMEEMAASYDQLMNKYYNKLLKSLKQEDQKTLITAQKAWLVYRDAEDKLIGTMTKEEYSGGGTIQTNIAMSEYADLIKKRAINIRNYYDSIIKSQ